MSGTISHRTGCGYVSCITIQTWLKGRGITFMLVHLMTWYRDRLFEWVMTVIMLGLATEIVIWPETIGNSSFRFILKVVSAEHMAAFFVVFGLMRIAALIANGSWPKHGPRLRAMGAGSAALMWGQMCVALLLLAPHNQGIPSPGIPVYFALTIGELVSAYRAMSDERLPG